MTITAAIVTLVLVYGVYRLLVKPGFGLIVALLSYAWHHKLLTLVLVGLFVISPFFANPANSLTFHDGAPGVVGYILVGFANLFAGIWIGLGHLASNLLQVPGKIGDIGGIENIGGYILAYALYGVQAIAEALVYWMSTFVLKAETLWNTIILIGLIVVLGGGANGIIGAAMTKGKSAGGGHAKPAGGHGGGHH